MKFLFGDLILRTLPSRRAVLWAQVRQFWHCLHRTIRLIPCGMIDVRVGPHRLVGCTCGKVFVRSDFYTADEAADLCTETRGDDLQVLAAYARCDRVMRELLDKFVRERAAG